MVTNKLLLFSGVCFGILHILILSSKNTLINPLLRSKIYLELLKYKKNQEMKELEDINKSIDKFKDSNKKR